MEADATPPPSLHLRAVLARRGLHHLMRHWSPDTESMVDPLDDPEIRTSARHVLMTIARGGWPDA